MKIADHEKYLGDYISSSLSKSIEVTLEKRKGLVKKAIFEIRAIVNDCRSKQLGGILVGLEIWNLAICPYLLNNSECFTEIKKKFLKNIRFSSK